MDDLDIKSFEEVIRSKEFTPHYGQLSRGQVFWSRDIHILKSAPGHVMHLFSERGREFVKIFLPRRN